MSTQTHPSTTMEDSTMPDYITISSTAESPTAAHHDFTGAVRAALIAQILGCNADRYTPVQRLRLAQVYDTMVAEDSARKEHQFSISDEHKIIRQRILQLAWPLPTPDQNTPLGLFRLTQLLDYHGMKVTDFTPILANRAVEALGEMSGANWEGLVNHHLSLTHEQKESFQERIIEAGKEAMFETDLAESLGALSMK